MTLTRKTTAAFAALVLTVLGVVAMPKAAHAAGATAACPVGYACIWDYTNYSESGRYWKQSANEQAVPATINNKASSAAANGKACYATRFYDNGAQATGSYFILHSKTRLPNSYYEDPYLANGAGLGDFSGQNWDNRISRIKFTGC